MVLVTAAVVLIGAITSVSALSPPLPGVGGFAGSVDSLENNATTTTHGLAWNTTESTAKYIIQFKTDSLSKRNTNHHSTFHKRAQEVGLSYTTRQTYNNEGTFIGVSISLENGSIDDLKSLENVANVWPVRKIGRPLAAIQPLPGKSVGEIQRREGSNEAVSFTIPHITGDIKPNNPHKMAGVDRAHALGYTGAGVKIAVIDTGVDYLHPSLGGCFGEGCKISFGYNFVDNTSDPLVQCISGGHGTHVMGIIGMEDPPDIGFGLLGVAPKATLGMYSIFGCTDSADDDTIIQAMLQAQTDGADIISMSLGSATHYESEDPIQTVSTALVESGIAIFAATGNDAGLYGAGMGIYWPSSPGTGPDVFAVGSVDNSVYPLVYKLTDSNGRRLEYSSVLPLNGPDDGLTVLVVNYGSDSELDLMGCYEEDYVSAVANVTDPSKYILAVLNGGCLSAAKGQVAKHYGFNYILSYSSDNWDETYIWSEFDVVDPDYNFNITPIVVNRDDSNTILYDYGRDPGTYKLFFNSSDYSATSPAYDHGGFMSNYSSWGPTLDTGTIKPQLSAPGANILSTWPLDPLNKGYAILSGTSMSTPFMAASFALLKEAYPDMKIKDAMALLQNSGTPMNWYYDESIISPPLQQGSGMVNLYNALTWQSTVIPPQVTLDTAGHNTPVKGNVTIYNRSSRSKTYTFSHKAAGLAEWGLWNGLKNQLFPIYATSVEFDEQSLLIRGGESAVLTFTVNPPYVEDPVFLPLYGGYITIHNNYETYTIPYHGQPWNLTWPGTIFSKWGTVAAAAARVLYPINEQLPSIHGYAVYAGIPTWTSRPLATNATFTMGRYGYFGMLWQLEEGTLADYARFDLVPANISFTPTLYGFDPSVVAIPEDEIVYPLNVNITDILGAPVVYTLKEFAGPVDNAAGSYSFWQYTLPEDAVPNADYRVLMRVLPAGGDYNTTSDWQSWLSAILTIDRTAQDQPALPKSEIYG